MIRAQTLIHHCHKSGSMVADAHKRRHRRSRKKHRGWRENMTFRQHSVKTIHSVARSFGRNGSGSIGSGSIGPANARSGAIYQVDARLLIANLQHKLAA